MGSHLLLCATMVLAVAGCETGDKRETVADAADETSGEPDTITDAADETPGSETVLETLGETGETASDTVLETARDTGPAPDAETPILQRPLAPGAVTCSAARDPGFALPGYFPTFELSDGPAGGPHDHYMAFASRDFDPVYRVQLAPLDAEGVLQASLFAEELGPNMVTAFAAAPLGDDIALAWHVGAGSPAIVLARVGTDGVLRAEPRALAGTEEPVQGLMIVPGEAGQSGALTLLWQTYEPQWLSALRMGRFAADGTPLGEVVTLVPADPSTPEDGGNAFAPRVGGGVVAAWAWRSHDAGSVRVAAFDGDGVPLGPPTIVATSASSQLTPALLAHGDGYLLTWAEGASLRVVRLGAHARPLGAPVALGPAPDAPGTPVSGQPIWLDAGSRVVLAWGMPDHSAMAGGGVYPLGWLLLDPATLAPASNLLRYEDASVRDGIRDGSIMHVRLTADGLYFRAYYQIVFHAGSGAGAAHITCVPAR